MKPIHILPLLMSPLFTAPGSLAQTQDVPGRLTQVVSSYAAGDRFMGTVLVSKENQVLLNKGFGQASVEWNVPNTPEVRFRLGSVSKQFTAALILLLEQQGKLHIDDPVTNYLHDLPESWKQVTLSELLDHSSGVPNLTGAKDFGSWQMTPHSKTEVLSYIASRPLAFTPGSKAEYSNSNYIVLGAVIEAVTHESYADTLRRYIFTPLEMHNSGLDTDEDLIARHAEGYKLDTSNRLIRTRPGSMTVPWSAGAIYSTTGDLLRWEQALFSGKVLSPAEFSKMTTAQKGDFGFGVEVHREGSLTEIDHSGSIEGFNTHMLYIPEKRIAVIVLGNVNGRAVDAMTSRLRDVALEQEVILPQERRTVSISPESLQQFKGAFHFVKSSDSSFDLTMTVTSRGLAAQGNGQKPLDLLFQGVIGGYARFYQPDLDAELDFLSDVTGKVNLVLLHQNGQVVHGGR